MQSFKENSTYSFKDASKVSDTTDVIIFGSGLVGSFLGALLARQGLSVLVLDDSTHPKFSVGESMIPYLTSVWSGLAKFYDIDLLSPDKILNDLAASVGIKENFGYVYHRVGKRSDTKEMFQHINPERTEMHLFRQAVDSYIVNGAIKYGARFSFNANVTNVKVLDDRVKVIVNDNKELECQYVIDSTGYKSVLAKIFKLRDKVPNINTNSSTCYTHMIDVEPFDRVYSGSRYDKKCKFHNGTLHHIFDGGWLWVIPFNNTTESRNPIASVGLQFDMRNRKKSPSSSDVIKLINSIPDVQQQFKNANVVRPWVSSPRIQYTSNSCTGKRWSILPHTYGFVDPLYSRGLCFSFDGIKALAPILLQAFDNKDFSHDQFKPLENLYKKLLQHNDDLVYGSYLSFKDYKLWKSWYSIWNLSTRLGEWPTMISARKDDISDNFFKNDHKGLMGELDVNLKRGLSVMEDVEKNIIPIDVAREQLELIVQKCWERERFSNYE